jgi:hypothetical protein
MSAPDPAPARLGYATPDTLGEAVLVIRTGRSGAVVFVVWGALFIAFAMSQVLAGRRGADWWPLVAAGLLLIGLGGWRLADRAPRLILNATELVSVPFRLIVPWSHVADAVIAYHAGTSLLILKLSDDAPHPAHRPDAPCPPEATEQDLVLPVAGFDLSPEAVLAEVRERIALHSSKSPADSDR